MIIRPLLSLALLLCPLPAFAASWIIDPSASSVQFSGTQDGQSFTGKFTSFTAAITFDPAVMDGNTVEVTLPMNTIESSSPMVQQEIAGADWFNAAAYPTASFIASTFRKIDEGHYEADGTLTIRAISLPVTLPFTFSEAEGLAHITSSVTLKRNDFGVGQGSWATDTSVGQDVKVEISLAATRAP